MSRLGKLPIKLPAGVNFTVAADGYAFKGPKGELHLAINPLIEAKAEEGAIVVAPRDKEAKGASAMWGLMWSLIKNAVEGVSTGFTKKLEINGVGYRAAVAGSKVNMNLGFSHPVEFQLPKGVTASVNANVLILESADKSLLGETAAKIRMIRKPEPYKGKGIKYADEVIRRKAGKAATKGK